MDWVGLKFNPNESNAKQIYLWIEMNWIQKCFQYIFNNMYLDQKMKYDIQI